MPKLIALFKIAPTDVNRAKLNTYMNRHMMAVCMLSIEETAYLRANGFKL